MIRRLILPILILVTALWFVGCSDKSTDTSTNPVDLNSDFGGYTATAEAPGFGDTDLLGAAAGEVAFTDPIVYLPAADSIISDPDAGFFHFRVVWGQLTYDSTATAPTDWTGSLTISRGVEVVRKLIAFERGQDYVLDRTDRRLIEWVSQTTVHHDGLAIDMYFPRPLPVIDSIVTPVVDTLGDTTWMTVVDTTWPDPVTVNFATGPYSATFTLGDLVALDTTIYLEGGNAVMFHAFKLDRLPCARGFLAGKWGVEDDTLQVFRGMWMTRHGQLQGWLQGSWGHDDQGKGVFYGKWIDEDGNFEGFLRGIWKAHPNRHANHEAFRHAGGWFAGKIFDAAHDEIGVLRGKYKSAEHPEKPGYFQGMWRLTCGEVYNDPWDCDRDNDGWDDDDDDHGDDDGYDDDHDDDDNDDEGDGR